MTGPVIDTNTTVVGNASCPSAGDDSDLMALQSSTLMPSPVNGAVVRFAKADMQIEGLRTSVNRTIDPYVDGTHFFVVTTSSVISLQSWLGETAIALLGAHGSLTNRYYMNGLKQL